MEPFNAERIEAQVTDNRALSVALREIGRLARVVEEQSGRIESLEGANVKRYAYPEPDAEPPYRMTEPENVGAVVVSGGFRLVRIWEVGHNWADLRTGKQYRWVSITDPHPYQNCTLTADDPEPPVGSVVRDEVRQVWRRELTGWEMTGSSQRYGWSEMVQLNFRSGAVTLLYRGEA